MEIIGKKIWYIIIGFGVLAGIPFLFYQDVGKAGQFGDSFGFANSLLNGLALLAIIYSIYLQRKELEETQKQFSKSIAAQEEQALLQYVPLKYEALEKLIKISSYKLAQSTANHRPKVEYDLKRLPNRQNITHPKINTPYKERIEEKLNEIPEIKNQKEELINLEQQLRELDQYMMLDNPEALRRKLVKTS